MAALEEKGNQVGFGPTLSAALQMPGNLRGITGREASGHMVRNPVADPIAHRSVHRSHSLNL
jgi:hypothetical protein